MANHTTPTPSSPFLFGQLPTPPARYHGQTCRSFYLPMRDGVRLAVDLHLPQSAPTGERFPALLVQSRYWRAMALKAPFKWVMSPEDMNWPMRGFKRFFTDRGYALVYVDVRGTGASFGDWPYPWHSDATQDGYDLVEWIISQPWSNGSVGAFGVSYLGMTAEFLCSVGHPAVKAVIPMFNQPDPFLDIAKPGGVFNARFIGDWGRFGRDLDHNHLPDEFGWLPRRMLNGVKPVDDDGDGMLLQQAIKLHQANSEVYATAFEMDFRDEIHPSIDACMDHLSIHSKLEEVAHSGAAIFGWGSWMDAGTADAALRRFQTLDNTRYTVIGAWEHGGQHSADPYLPPETPVNPTLPAQWTEMVRFFDAHLTAGRDETYRDNLLHYYTLGAGRWQRASTWPPPGTQTQRWYLAEAGQLLPEASQSPDGADVYAVDFQASTGDANRWWELSGVMRGTVIYRQRAEAARHLLTYCTPPLPEDIEIAGYPIVEFYCASTEPDGALFAYLEDVHPDGQVTYLTEGQLRLIHRQVSTEKPPYRLQVPYHTFRAADALPMTPGQVERVTFGLLPISALVRRGHALRLGIAGHDEGTFARLPAGGQPVFTILRSSASASCIDIPFRTENP